ncbi:MAG: cytochrome P460 family protein [Tagaea sp.]
MKAPIILAAALTLLASCATGPRIDHASCRVERLAASPAPASALGGLGSPPAHLTTAEIEAVADCLRPRIAAAFASVGDRAVAGKSWAVMSRAYKASEHGMFLQVYADPAAAESYRRYEQGARIGRGGTIVKRSFRVETDGRAAPYRTFVMERMTPGYAPDANDWRFAVYEPDGSLIGETGGQGDARVRFCVECHQAARVQDFLLYVPPAYRIPLSVR